MSGRFGMADAVKYIARMALYMGTAFFLLALAGLLFMSPGEVSRGLYYVVLGINAVVIASSLLLTRFMRKSDERLAREKKAQRKGPTIDDWLKKHE